MLSTLSSLSYHCWVLALIAASIAGTVFLILAILAIYQQCATYAKAYKDYSRLQKFLHSDAFKDLTKLPGCFFLIAVVAAASSFGSVILHLLIGGGTSAH